VREAVVCLALLALRESALPEVLLIPHRLHADTRRMTGSRDGRASLGDAARELAEYGLRVLPLYPRSKRPRIKDWPSKATNQVADVAAYWRKWPSANIGVATGDGLIVVDLDGHEAEAFAAERGLPKTPTVKTPRGRHLYFAGDGPGSKNQIHPRIDVQAAGVQVVAPPSIHESGKRYEWLVGLEVPLAPLPEWATAPKAKPRQPEGIEGKFVEGERNNSLYGLGCDLRAVGLTEQEIEVTLLMVNEDRCEPPLTEEAVLATAGSAAQSPRKRTDNDLLAVARITTKPTALAVYVALRKSCGYGDRCFMSYEKLKELTGRSHDALVNAVDDLVACGLIEKKKQQRRGFDMANEYRLLEIPTTP
jgi:hypothetical protein